MHELSLCRSIARIAEHHCQGRGVERVGVRLGMFRQAVPEAMERCWQVVTADTRLAGSELEFEIIPLVVGCRDCGQRTRLDEVWLRCGSCGSAGVEVVEGDEFLLTYIELAESPAPGPGVRDSRHPPVTPSPHP